MDLKAFRSLLSGVKTIDGATTAINAFIIPSEDDHQNEYPPENAKRREFATGFTGSKGLALVTESKAALWTDGRYWLQANAQLSKEWTLMKEGLASCPTLSDFLTKELTKGDKVGVDPKHVTHAEYAKLAQSLKKRGISIVCVAENPVDMLWEQHGRPSEPDSPIFAVSEQFTGASVAKKLEKVRAELHKKGCAALVVSALDEVAWLFNLRGSDVAYNPVFLSYALVGTSFAYLFVDTERLPADAAAALSPAVTVAPYKRFFQEFEQMVPSLAEQGQVWVGDKCSQAVWSRVPEDKGLDEITVTARLKAVKNETELEGMRRAHIRDAVALCTLFPWLEKQVAAGAGPDVLRETAVADKAEQLRKQQEHYVSLSFPTISSIGANGSIIHYKPEKATCDVIDNQRVFLMDSGAQYLDGTTDVTRTMHFGQPSAEEKQSFTAVLKGHIALARTKFPQGVNGHALDAIARAPIWQYGLNYPHGTGHGVGSFLNVHEGPMSLSASSRAIKANLEAGNVVTIEPGYYRDNEYGIRIENVVIIKPSEDAPDFLEFEPATLVPIQEKMIDRSMLTPTEVEWLNAYHARCRDVIGKELQTRNLIDEMEWLFQNTEPIQP